MSEVIKQWDDTSDETHETSVKKFDDDTYTLLQLTRLLFIMNNNFLKFVFKTLIIQSNNYDLNV